MKKAVVFLGNMVFVLLLLAGCGNAVEQTEQKEPETVTENVLQTGAAEDEAEEKDAKDSAADHAEKGRAEEGDTKEESRDILRAPSREEIFAAREKVLEGMLQEEADRLGGIVKAADDRMESAYLEENIFDKLSDEESEYWHYFEQEGGMQSEDFVNLVKGAMNSVQDEALRADLLQIIDLTDMAAGAHDVRYAYELYKVLHDLDYFLFGDGMTDGGEDREDAGTAAVYYGVLHVYDGEPFRPGNKYYAAKYQYVESDETEYGTVKQEHEEFFDQSGVKSFYYDMECFYFDKTYPAVVNETLQTYYDGKREAYRLDSEGYTVESYGEPHIPYDLLMFYYVAYAGDDYVSVVFNDVCYMGGAHPDSWLEGITIDCSTGEIVDAGRFTDDSAEETGEQIRAVLGENSVYTPEHWSYYITDRSVVFFYYNPRFWDQVATKRVR